MKTHPLVVSVLALTLGCATTSFYKSTNAGAGGKPVQPSRVRVASTKSDVHGEWTEVGQFRGKANTQEAALAAAKQACGHNGANLYILNAAPFESDGGFRVDGICARTR